MKKTSLILNIVFAVAIIVLFILHFTNNKGGIIQAKTDSEAALQTDSNGIPALRIAYVNTDTIISNYGYYMDQISIIQNDKIAAEKRVMNKMKTLEEEYKNYIYKVKLGLITEEQAESEFSKKNEELEAYRTRASNALMEKQDEISSQLYDSVFNAVARFNKHAKYTFIMAHNSINNTMLHADHSFDVTQVILDDLNSSYDKLQESKK